GVYAASGIKTGCHYLKGAKAPLIIGFSALLPGYR
ncbi:hypothetical protein ECP03048168_4432, partial [Escherichia coli P0304816.8]